MSDLHLRILRLVARRTQRDLDSHDSLARIAGSAARAQRRELAHVAEHAQARLVAAQARRW